MTDGQRRRVLLGLIGVGEPDHAALDSLSAADWFAIGQMACNVGLGAWLHRRLRDRPLPQPVPPAVLEAFAEAHRAASIAWLVQQADLAAIIDCLARAGIRSVALKGAWLARYCYAEPGLRPMGDIDLLLDPGDVMAAFELLLAAGFEQARPFELSVADTIRYHKHLPQLRSPRGTPVELHMRCWEPAGPAAQDARMLERARRMSDVDAALYPAADDMLVHLAVHACANGRFDNGPRSLIDIDALIQREAIDWPDLWQRAAAGGFLRHLALVLSMIERWLRPGILAATQCPVTATGEAIACAPDVLLADGTLCRQTQLLADIRTAARSGALFAAVRGRLLGRGAVRDKVERPVKRDFSGHGGYLRWLISSAGQAVRAFSDPRSWQMSADWHKVQGWLDMDDKPPR